MHKSESFDCLIEMWVGEFRNPSFSLTKLSGSVESYVSRIRESWWMKSFWTCVTPNLLVNRSVHLPEQWDFCGNSSDLFHDVGRFDTVSSKAAIVLRKSNVDVRFCIKVMHGYCRFFGNLMCGHTFRVIIHICIWKRHYTSFRLSTYLFMFNLTNRYQADLEGRFSENRLF